MRELMFTASKKSALGLLMILVFASVLQGSIHTASAQSTGDSQLSELTPRNWKTQAIDPYGEDGQIVLDSQNNPHVLYRVNDLYERPNSGLNYAKCVNGSWVTIRVSKDGVNGFLFIDSADNPKILYQVSNTMMLAAWNGTDWVSKRLGLQDVGWRYLAAESNGKLYFVYSKISYSNGLTWTTWYYATQDGSGWTYQKIDEESRDYGSIGSILSSLIIDSNGLPHVVYGDYVEYHFPSNNMAYGLYTAYDVKYATLENGTWTVQTVAKNATAYVGCISNLALNSKGQPSFCYIQDNNFTYDEKYGTCSNTQTMNYAYWDGLKWSIEQIDPYPQDYAVSFSQPRLRIDTSGNPQSFYFRENYQKENQKGLICAMKTGSQWATKTIGQYNCRDLQIDSLGNLHVAFDLVIGSYHGPALYGNLTYATLASSYFPAPPSASPSPTDPDLSWLVIVPLLLSAFIVAVLLRHQKNSTKSS